MNGAAVLLCVWLGTLLGNFYCRARRFGLNDCRQCLDLGHPSTDRHGYCSRCGTRIVMVAP